MHSKLTRFLQLILVVILVISTNALVLTRNVEALTQKQINAKVDSLTDGKEFDYNRILVKYKQDANVAGKIMNKEGKVMAQVAEVKDNTVITELKDREEIEAKIQSIGKENVKKLLKKYLADPNVEYAEPNYVGHTASWTPSGSTTKPGDYNESNHWYYTQEKVKEMWYDQGCGAGADCGGSSSVIVAVIDTGLAFESYDDTGDNGFTDYLWDNNYYVNGLGWLGINNGKNFTAIGTDYNPASGFNIYTNSGEIPNDGKDNDCNGIIDDYNGFDAYAWYPKDSYTGDNEWYYYVPDYYSGIYCTSGMADDYSASNYKNLRKMGHPTDTIGHGSFVTGSIAGVVDNTVGSSVSPAHKITIMPIAANVTFENYFYGTEVLSGIYYAVENGADVINMSLGGFGYSQSMQDAINYAAANNVVVVAASGNDDQDSDPNNGIGCDNPSADADVAYPAAFNNVIAVGAVNSNNSKSCYSNDGNALDIVAYVGEGSGAGTAAWQETLTCAFSCNESSTFSTTNTKYGVGTSFASPQVAAAAALIKSKNPNMTATEISELLIFSSTDIGVAGYDVETGFGVLNYENIYLNTWANPFLVQGMTYDEISVAAAGTTVVQAVKGIDNYLWQRTSPDGINWGTWTKQDKMTDIKIAMGTFGTKVVQSIKDLSANIWTRTFDGSTWTAWSQAGMTYTPISMIEFNSKIYQVVRGIDSTIWMRSSTDGTTWGTWTKGTGLSKSGIALFSFNGKFIQVLQGIDDGIWSRTSTDGSNWTTWTRDGMTIDEVTGVSFGGTFYQAVRGIDQGIWMRSSTDGTTWTSWVKQPGLTSTRISFAADANYMFESLRGMDGGVWTRMYNGNIWTSWYRSGYTLSPITMYGSGTNIIQIFRDTNNYIQTRSYY